MLTHSPKIELRFDKAASWAKVAGRHSVFLDTNCWIDMADERDDVACRVRDTLRAFVSSGRVFCPLSWGLLEELSSQKGDSLKRTASLMAELSVNIIYSMRTEVFEWEVARSVAWALGEASDQTLNGLFAPPAAFVGSRFFLEWPADSTLSDEAQNTLRKAVACELGAIDVVELADNPNWSSGPRKPPALSQAARRALESSKGDKRKLFLMEATNEFRMYVYPFLAKYPQSVIRKWALGFGRPGDAEVILPRLPGPSSCAPQLHRDHGGCRHATGQDGQDQRFP